MIIRLIVVAAALAAALLPLDAVLVERWYSAGVYPRLQHLLTPISNALPIAWLDVLSVLAAAWCGWFLWRTLRRRGEPLVPRVLRAASTLLFVVAIAYLAFLSLWGLNYRRVPMTRRLAMEQGPPSTQRVAQLGRDVVGRVNAAHGPAHAAGWTEPAWRGPRLRASFDDVQRQLSEAPGAVPGRLKQTLFGPFFRWSAVDGMVNPFGLEVLANPDLLPFEQPFVTAHEWAHLAGYADESEANFVGWLTTIHADPPSQYSGWLYLYWQIAAELPAAERQLVSRDLGDGPRRDIAAIRARLQRGDLPMLRRASWLVYDSYLKANRVEEGVRSYGEVVSLILQARFEDGWRPVRRPSP